MSKINLMRKKHNIACPICDHENSWSLPFYDLDRAALTYKTSGYHWRVCLFCGNGYPSYQPNLFDLQRYWNNNRVDGVSDDGSEAIYQMRLKDAAYWANETYKFVSLHTNKNTGKFLDIACGLGATVRKFKDMGWSSFGIDADQTTKISHDRLGVDTKIGQFEAMKLEQNFDLISIAHAIYFITDYKSFIYSIKSSLGGGGLLLVVISNFTSSFGANSPSQVHTWYPTPTSLSNAMLLNGFHMVGRKTLRGSTLVLFRNEDRVIKPSRAFWSAFMLRSHNIRYHLIGRHIVRIARAIKRGL